MKNQRHIAMIHIAKKDLALDDDTYRAMLKQITGLDSCAKMKPWQLQNVIKELKAKGWKPRGNQQARRKVSPKSSHKKPGEKSMADKIRAFWIAMKKDGLIEDGSEKALHQFCHRMTGKYSPDWLTAFEATRVIEALKKWRTRLEDQHV